MFMIACLYNGFLLSAGHVRRTSLSYVSTTGTLQEGSHVGTAFISFHFGLLGFQCLFFSVWWAFISFLFGFLGRWICEHLCTRRVSLRYRYRYRFGTGENAEKKEQLQALHANMNELIVFQDIATAFGSSPYCFRFGATFKTKRLTRRLHEEFSRLAGFSHVAGRSEQGSKECVHAKTAKTALIEHSLLHTYITYILEAFFSFTLQVLPVCNACNLSCFLHVSKLKKKRVS